MVIGRSLHINYLDKTCYQVAYYLILGTFRLDCRYEVIKPFLTSYSDEQIQIINISMCSRSNN